MWLRLRQIALVAHDLDPVVDDLRFVFGLGRPFNDPGVATFGLRNAVLPAGQQFIEVVAPVRDGTAGGRYLERRNGDSGYMVICQCDDHAPVKARIDALGVRKVVEHDSEHYRIMQLHPRDTGGSFLEIDVQVGGEDLDGPWEPAGPEWQRERTHELVAITAAEIQGDDPQALAHRWSEIVGLPVVTSASDAHTISLANAAVRFVPVDDGRGEGLGGIDVTVGDAATVLARAEARGRRTGVGSVSIGGLRIAVR
jgi:hypothetical protein